MAVTVADSEKENQEASRAFLLLNLDDALE